jgi:hypothetical protein
LAFLQEDTAQESDSDDSEVVNDSGLGGGVNADLFDLLATTHNVSPGVVQALAQDLLQRLIASNQSSTTITTRNDALELGSPELPMAVFSTGH